jgi:hypothetical protein
MGIWLASRILLCARVRSGPTGDSVQVHTNDGAYPRRRPCLERPTTGSLPCVGWAAASCARLRWAAREGSARLPAFPQDEHDHRDEHNCEPRAFYRPS